MSESAYRALAVVEQDVEPKRIEPARVSGGWLVLPEKEHKCDPPGWWRRLFSRIPADAWWICDCGIAHLWSGVSWHQRDSGRPEDIITQRGLSLPSSLAFTLEARRAEKR